MMERPDLAPYAMTSSNSHGRRYQEPQKDTRTLFERDRDRIIHCAAFRRLEYKTQVFVNHEGDYYRTRLTHSLEVAQISRGIARQLSLNEDLVEALALSHDLGHTPFGHTGEEVLNELMAGQGGFEHNQQSLRTVEVLEQRYPDFPGLNLAWETREGIAKHSPGQNSAVPDAYAPDTPPCLEAQLIDIADEIAYNNHDIDDGLQAGYIHLQDLEELSLWRAVRRHVKERFSHIQEPEYSLQTISYLISYLVNDLIQTTAANIRRQGVQSTADVRACDSWLVGLSPEVARQNRELKRFLHQHLYRHEKVERMKVKTARFLRALFHSYADYPSLLPLAYRQRFAADGKLRVICDYIAAMTDRFALDEYRRLFEPYEPV